MGEFPTFCHCWALIKLLPAIDSTKALKLTLVTKVYKFLNIIDIIFIYSKFNLILHKSSLHPESLIIIFKFSLIGCKLLLNYYGNKNTSHNETEEKRLTISI